eukprot:Partr_v1_DN23451_c0_g1_i2_m52508 putative PIN2 TERF1 interacting, telomerase inhibitor 1
MGLAGPRDKQRIDSDPRNMQWVNDKSKFGYRMLEKMGWSVGKGLGATESGKVEHVKIVKKDDQFGIGAKKSNHDNWLESTDAFSQLLSSMNEELVSNGTTSTLSDISSPALITAEKMSGDRHSHRKKYIQAKRQVMQSSVDLNAVLGIKTNSLTVEKSAKNIINTLTRDDLVKVESVSTTDYFAALKQHRNIASISSRKADKSKKRREGETKEERRARKKAQRE